MAAADPTEEEQRLQKTITAAGALFGEAKKDRKGKVRSGGFSNRTGDPDSTQTANLQRNWEFSRFVSMSTTKIIVATPAGKQLRNGSKTEGVRDVQKMFKIHCGISGMH